jgi:hypothetical protein
MARAKVKVIVFPGRGLWVAGEFWPQGESVRELTDDPPDPHQPTAGFTLERKLAQLEHLTGGQVLAGTGVLPDPGHAYGPRGGYSGEPEQRAPALLAFEILERSNELQGDAN